MIIYHDLNRQAPKNTAVALGFFDGVHIGHREVLKKTLGFPDLMPAAFTFHYEDLSHRGKGGLLTPTGEKHALLESCGIRLLAELPYETICHMDGETFFNRVLRDMLRARVICCGQDFRFGREAAWGVNELEQMCRREGITLQTVDEVTLAGQPVHATAIRQALEQGDVERVNAMLGRPFSFASTVIHGNELGRTVGMPTINLAADSCMVLPRFGVYASRTVLDGAVYDSITNIGVKPTVGSDRVLYETYLFGFDGDVYGHTATVNLYAFIRPEQKFPSLEAVRAQVERDMQTVCCILAEKAAQKSKES